MHNTKAKPEPANDDAGFPGRYISADERRAAGKALRDATPRAAHGGWKPPEDRRDPIELLHESNEGRIPELIPIRFGRMAQSPFAFYRGSAAVMAADLAATPISGLRVQACGDAHLMNFGGFATPERNIFFDINDFDETLPAPWEWDVKRLAASIVIAARHLNLPDSEAAKGATEAVRSYRERMADYASMRALDVWYDRIDLDRVLAVLPTEEHVERVKGRVEQARRKSLPEGLFPKLVEHLGSAPRIKDEPPLIFHPSEEQAPGLKSGYADGIERYRESLPEHVRTLFDRFHLFDLAIKAVGVGSVGTFCALGLFMAAGDDPIFLQVKEARKSVLEALRRQVPPQEPRRAGRRGPAPHAIGKRHFPWLDARTKRPRLLLSPASRREGLSDPGRLGPRDAAGIQQALRLGGRTGARTVRRSRKDRWLHGIQFDVRRRGVRVCGRIRRPEPPRLPRLHQGDPRGPDPGRAGGLISTPDEPNAGPGFPIVAVQSQTGDELWGRAGPIRHGCPSRSRTARPAPESAPPPRTVARIEAAYVRGSRRYL